MGTRPQPRPQVASLPLALPLVACCNVVAAFDDWKDVTKKRLPVFYYMYDTEEQNAGSTLAAPLRGPNDGVHFRLPVRTPWRS